MAMTHHIIGSEAFVDRRHFHRAWGSLRAYPARGRTTLPGHLMAAAVGGLVALAFVAWGL